MELSDDRVAQLLGLSVSLGFLASPLVFVLIRISGQAQQCFGTAYGWIITCLPWSRVMWKY
jgi:hypothetical protein